MNDNFNNGRLFCTKCGAPNKAGYRFCVRCGAKLMVLDPKPEPEISNELPQTEPVRSEPMSLNRQRMSLNRQRMSLNRQRMSLNR